MTRSQVSAVVLAALAALTVPQPAGAQLGGLIKKKVTEAVRAPEKPAEATRPATQSGEAPQTVSRTNAGYPVLNPGALVISQSMLTRLTRGMDAELAMQKEFEVELARYPTPDEYQLCQSRAMNTPEGIKVLTAIANVPENATAEQAQQIMAKMASDTEALIKKACPLNPEDWTDYKRSEQLKEIRVKAAQQSRLSRPVSKSGSPQESAASDTIAEAPVAGVDVGLTENEYSVMIERLVKFCELKLLVDTKPKPGGLKYPGDGDDVFWVWTEAELRELEAFDCDAFRKKYYSLLGLPGS